MPGGVRMPLVDGSLRVGIDDAGRMRGRVVDGGLVVGVAGRLVVAIVVAVRRGVGVRLCGGLLFGCIRLRGGLALRATSASAAASETSIASASGSSWRRPLSALLPGAPAAQPMLSSLC